ncbi:hypothetical protein [Vagococcus sp. WN89Y]|uniref:hypothetical protein n=1 Tax=Vagococcus sp. WN89Y TaxID=3457258 RepID=UPI003FCC7140
MNPIAFTGKASLPRYTLDINNNINLERFYCPKIEFTEKQDADNLETVIKKIRVGTK